MVAVAVARIGDAIAVKDPVAIIDHPLVGGSVL